MSTQIALFNSLVRRTNAHILKHLRATLGDDFLRKNNLNSMSNSAAIDEDGESIELNIDLSKIKFPNVSPIVKQPELLQNCTMRDYQLAGLRWLTHLYLTGLNGILADEMGLGKTLQTISLLAHLREAHNHTHPHLILVPLTTLSNWIKEFKKFCPSMNVLRLHGDRAEREDLIQNRLLTRDFDVCVTTYEMASRERRQLKRIRWGYLIVDEAHRLKNENSLLSRVLRQYSSRNRLLITGTPLQNNLHELWALLNFLLPTVFDSSGDFNSIFHTVEQDAGFTDPAQANQPKRGPGRPRKKPLKDSDSDSDADDTVSKKKTSSTSSRNRYVESDDDESYDGSDSEQESSDSLDFINDDDFADEPLHDAADADWEHGAVSSGDDDDDDDMTDDDSGDGLKKATTKLPSASATKGQSGATTTAIAASAASAVGKAKPADSKDASKTDDGEKPATPEGEIDETVRSEMLSRLHTILRPFVLRRLKSDVASSLPPKKEVYIHVGMTNLQRQIYRDILVGNVESLGGKTKQRQKLLNIVMQLRKCCNHPYLFDGIEDQNSSALGEHLVSTSGKMIILDKLLKKLYDQGSKVLIFCQMTRQMDILEDYCNYRGYQYFRIDGNTGSLEREEYMDKFNRPGHPNPQAPMYVDNPSLLDAHDPTEHKFIFLLSTRAGGVGINLVGADTVVLYDSDWNPQMDLQAMDRAHRIGQTRPVNVYRFVCEHSIEERIMMRAETKLQLDRLVIQQGRQPPSSNTMSATDMVDMIRAGANNIFSATDMSNLDEDIDAILTRGEAKTDELNSRLAKFKGFELTLNAPAVADDAQNTPDLQEILGHEEVNDDVLSRLAEEAKLLQKKQYEEQLLLEQQQRQEEGYDGDKRDRQRFQYENDRKYRSLITSVRSSFPRPVRYRILDCQLYNVPRLEEIYQIECEKYEQCMTYLDNMLSTLMQNVALPPDQQQPLPDPDVSKFYLPEELVAEREAILNDGFPNWKFSEFRSFIRGSERYGRNSYEQIAREVGPSKSLQQVKIYAQAFWQRYKWVRDGEKLIRNILVYERRVAVSNAMVPYLLPLVNGDKPEFFPPIEPDQMDQELPRAQSERVSSDGAVNTTSDQPAGSDAVKPDPADGQSKAIIAAETKLEQSNSDAASQPIRSKAPIQHPLNIYTVKTPLDAFETYRYYNIPQNLRNRGYNDSLDGTICYTVARDGFETQLLKESITQQSLFQFDYFAQSRLPSELHRRVEALGKSIAPKRPKKAEPPPMDDDGVVQPVKKQRGRRRAATSTMSIDELLQDLQG